MGETAQSLKKAIMDEFDSALKSVGFKKVRHGSDKFSFFIVYRLNERYIRFRGDLHPRDYPFGYSFVFGEGSHEYPESAWNSISMISIIENENPTDLEKCKDVFSLLYEDSHDEIRQKIKAAHGFLEKYGQSFLSNDLEQFHQLRAELNQSKTRFADHVPQSDIEYRQEYQMQIDELKKKIPGSK